MSRRRSQTRDDALATPFPFPGEDNSNSSSRYRSKPIFSLRKVALISGLALTVVIALLFFGPLQIPPEILRLPLSDATGSSIQDANFQDNLLLRLHPESHAHRKATVIHEHWRITTGFRRPDGVLKRVYLVNDAFPGPTFEARSGDTLVIEVENALEEKEGLSIHWHGLSMRNANRMDGAVGMTQAPIASGDVFTYEFKIDDNQYGTFWYHAHDGVQRADGLYGGLIVHQPREQAAEMSSDYLLMIGDWYHRSAEELLAWYMRARSFGNEPVPDSMLINGMGTFNCSDAVPARLLDCKQASRTSMPSIRLTNAGTQKLRVINTGAYAGFNLHIPGATMTAVAVDGGSEVNGTAAETLGTLWPGQRTDVMIGSTLQSQNVLQLSMETKFKYSNPSLTRTQSFGIMWSGEGTKGTKSANLETDRFDLDSVKSVLNHSSALPERADMTLVLYTTTLKLAHLNNVPHGFINHTSWQPQASPQQPLVALERSQWDANQLVPHIPYDTAKPIWVDIVLNNLDEEGHPFHLHGYDFYVVASGSSDYVWGSFNPYEDPEPPNGGYDLVNPVKRDTYYVPKRGYAVLRFLANNDGLWMFHCHVLWHQASGMAMGLDVR